MPGRATRAKSSCDLLLLSTAAALGAASGIFLAPLLRHFGHAGPELTRVIGAFLVGYLRRFGLTGTGIGSQIYIGQLLAYGACLTPVDLPMVVVVGLLATVASVVPRVLSGPAEHPAPVPAPLSTRVGNLRPELAMGLQSATAALLIVILNATIGLTESAWAITACTYANSGSASATTGFERGFPGTSCRATIGVVPPGQYVTPRHR